MSKYVILGNNLYKTIRHAADFSPDQVSMHVTIDGARIEKIFQNPVTALAYDVGSRDRFKDEFEFDKKDIIKALDFWINDRVLENEKLLKLHNRLEDFHERELRDLIQIKTQVEKMDNDTKFKRFSKSYANMGNRERRLGTDTVEFYYTPKQQKYNSNEDEFMVFRNIPTVSWSSVHGDDGEPNIRLWGGRHNDNSLRDFTFSGGPMAENVPNPTGARTRRRISSVDRDPNNWIVERMGTDPRLWCVVDRQSRIIARNFRTQGTAQAYIRQHLENRVDSPNFDPNRPAQAPVTRRLYNGVDLSVTQGNDNPHTWVVRPTRRGAENRFDVVDRNNVVIQISGDIMLDNFASQEMAQNSIDGYRQVYDQNGWRNSNGARTTDTRLRTEPAHPTGPDHLLHSNLHPGIPAHTDIMHIQGPRRTIGIDPGFPSSTEDTGQLIRDTMRNIQPTFTEFRDMYIDTMNVSIEGDGYQFDLDFRGMSNGARMSCKFGGSNNIPLFLDNNRHDGLDNNPHTIRIFGRNRILLDGTEYTVLEPVRVTWDRILPPPTTTTGIPILRTEVTENDEFIDYYNMSTMYQSDDMFPSENHYTTYNMGFRNDLVDIEVDLYMTGRDTYHVSPFEHHTVRIFHNRKDIIEIDGRRIHVLEMEITYK